ncbi:MAG TPA: ABC transporter permease [Candidatus Acidoferrum sp.]|jgi:ABC-2 type transport system permease protein|nr:ABC transporter permease [Candidatus Acidoferrum sp.]
MMATWALTKIRIRLAARNRLFLFFSLLMPMLFLIGAVIFIKERGGPVSNYILGALLTVTVMGSFWGLSVQLVTFREQGILRRFRLAPVGAGPMLASSILSNYVMAIPTLLVEVMVCRWVLHITNWGNPWAMVVLATFGSAAFSAFGLIVASVTNTMQETQVINQLIWMGFLFLSGATVPLTALPRWIQHATLFSPATYLATGLEASSTGVIASRDFATDTLGLAVTVLVCFEISRRLFRWEPEAKVPPRAKLWVLAALVPFFLFGIFENFHGGMLRRVDTSFRAVLGDDRRDAPPPPQYSPQPSDAR